MALPRMKSGYCFIWKGEVQWQQRINDEDWEIEIYDTDGKEQNVGDTHIDGSYCLVFMCSDGQIRSQTRVSTEGG